MKHFALIAFLVVAFLQKPEEKNTAQEPVVGQITYKERFYYLNGSPGYFTALLTFDSIASLQTSHRYGMDQGDGDAAQSDGNDVAMVQGAFDEKGTLFYRNRVTKQFLTRGKAVKPFPATIVTENWVDIDWKIKDDYKTLLGYKVQKAVGTFRGRTWTAWFAKDIAYPFGPAKLHGLPGIILEAGDKSYHYIATEICYPCDPDKTEKIEVPHEERVYTLKEFIYLTDNMAVFSMLEFQKQNKTWNPGRPMKCLYPATEKSIWQRRNMGTDILYEWEDKNTKRAIYNKDTLNATVDYKAAREIGSPPPMTIPPATLD